MNISAEWIKEHKIDCPADDLKAICNNEKLLAAVQADIDHHNQTFGKWEQVKKFELTPEIWSIDEGHLTPTMKLKRKVVKEKFKTLIDSIYN